jgi:NTP pyrophosphatase (non-canonical NTP hydrolase)
MIDLGIENFVGMFNLVSREVNRISHEHGFWDEKRNDGEVIALIHSELSEALEALRDNNPTSKRLVQFTSVEEELADAIIRIMDYAWGNQLSLARAILAKMEYNEGRDFMHGKSF